VGQISVKLGRPYHTLHPRVVPPMRATEACGLHFGSPIVYHGRITFSTPRAVRPLQPHTRRSLRPTAEFMRGDLPHRMRRPENQHAGMISVSIHGPEHARRSPDANPGAEETGSQLRVPSRAGQASGSTKRRDGETAPEPPDPGATNQEQPSPPRQNCPHRRNRTPARKQRDKIWLRLGAERQQQDVPNHTGSPPPDALATCQGNTHGSNRIVQGRNPQKAQAHRSTRWFPPRRHRE